MTTRWQQIASTNEGEGYATTYDDRFTVLAAEGEDIHGEAALVTRHVDPPARVLDAGCGTGRIAVRLAELGYVVTGVDVDASMLAVARRNAPDLDWREVDLATMDLGERYDLVLLAGNIWPLLEPDTLGSVAQRLAEHVELGGHVLSGFGLDDEHLPDGCAATELPDVEAALAMSGLRLIERYSSWDGAAFGEQEGYVVLVHALPTLSP